MISSVIILGMASDTRRDNVTSSLIGWARTHNDTCKWSFWTSDTRDEKINIRSVGHSPTIASFTFFVWRNAFDNAITSQAHGSKIIWASHITSHATVYSRKLFMLITKKTAKLYTTAPLWRASIGYQRIPLTKTSNSESDIDILPWTIRLSTRDLYHYDNCIEIYIYILINTDFRTWLLIGCRLCCHLIKSYVWTSHTKD